MARPKPRQTVLITVVVVVGLVLGAVLVVSYQRATGPRESTDLLQANPVPMGAQR